MLVAEPPRQYVIDDTSFGLKTHWWPGLQYVGDDDYRWCVPFLAVMTHDEDAPALIARCMDEDDPLDDDTVNDIATTLVRAATGREWWVTARLCGVVVGAWDMLDGRLLSGGCDLLELLTTSPARALNAVEFIQRNGMDDKQRAQFDAALAKPPSVAARQRKTQEEDAAAFEEAMRSFSG